MGQRLLEMHYEPGQELVVRFRPQRLRLLTEAAVGHVRAANREFLLALRALIDGAIQRTEPRREAAPKRKRIKVTKAGE